MRLNSNNNLILFKTSSSKGKVIDIENNPFLSNKCRGQENRIKGSTLEKGQKSTGSLIHNSFAPSVRTDPYAVWGITSQIRIA